MSKHYRFVLIGIGGMGGIYAKAVGDVANATLVAGSCRTEAKGRKFAGEFDCQWFGDTEQMLVDIKPDVAIISTPSGNHLESALLCAQHGVHMACTKPLEITTDRCDQIIAAADQAGIVLAGMFPNRFTPVMQPLYEAAQQGRFGDLAVINSYTPWWRDDAYYSPDRWQGTKALDGGGAVMNQSIHGVDAVQWLAAATMPDLPREKNPVEEVFAYIGRRAHSKELLEVEDTAVATLRFVGGALGQLLCTTSMYPGTLKSIQISGRDGTATTCEDELVCFDFRDARPEDKQTVERLSSQSSGGGAGDPMAINYTYETAQFRALIKSLDAGEGPLIDGREARKAVAIVEAIYESARTGRPVAPR